MHTLGKREDASKAGPRAEREKHQLTLTGQMWHLGVEVTGPSVALGLTLKAEHIVRTFQKRHLGAEGLK